MGFLDKWFGRKKAEPTRPTEPRPLPQADVPPFISVVDDVGRRLDIPRETWRTQVLPDEFRKHWRDAGALDAAVTAALRDGFVEDSLPAARQLHAIDRGSSRSSAVLASAFRLLGRYAEAVDVLEAAIRSHAPDGLLLLGLAKVQSAMGRKAEAAKTLWRSLEIDPNLSNAVQWLALTEREQNGPRAEAEALERVAQLPGSWQAQIYQARAELDAKHVPRALDLYRTARDRNTDALFQISADLGQRGHVRELIEICEPGFDVERHGLPLGNNLIKAHVDLRDAAGARRILTPLLAANRPDWRDTLAYWEAEVDKLSVPNEEVHRPITLTFMTLEGPVWARTGSPYAADLQPKEEDAVVLAVMCGSADPAPGTTSEHVVRQAADVRGRLSRAIPMLLAEEIHLRTRASAVLYVPWVTEGGFALSEAPWDTSVLDHVQLKPDYLLTTHLTPASGAGAWRVEVRLLRCIDASELGVWEAPLDLEKPNVAALALLERVLAGLDSKQVAARSTSPVPERPSPERMAQYLGSLENALAIGAEAEGGTDTLYGVRSILDGLLALAAGDERGVRSRYLLLSSLERISARRQEFVQELKDRVLTLQRRHPLPPNARAIADAAVARLWPAPAGGAGA